MVLGLLHYLDPSPLIVLIRHLFVCSGSATQAIGYAIMIPAPPFPVLVLGYTINGFGLSVQASTLSPGLGYALLKHTQDAGANGFVASLKKGAATKMGILHAVYGSFRIRFVVHSDV